MWLLRGLCCVLFFLKLFRPLYSLDVWCFFFLLGLFKYTKFCAIRYCKWSEKTWLRSWSSYHLLSYFSVSIHWSSNFDNEVVLCLVVGLFLGLRCFCSLCLCRVYTIHALWINGCHVSYSIFLIFANSIHTCWGFIAVLVDVWTFSFPLNSILFSLFEYFPLYFDFLFSFLTQLELWLIIGATFLLWFGPTVRLTISDPDLIREIFASKSEFYEKNEAHPLVKQLEGDGLLSLKGEKWAHHRKIITPTLHMENLKVSSDFSILI